MPARMATRPATRRKPAVTGQRRRQTKLNERALVSAFIARLRIGCQKPFFVYVDRDSGAVRHLSGFDFLIAYKGRAAFFEAKREFSPLRPFQSLTETLVTASGTRYNVLRFFDVKSLADFVVCIGEARCHISRATFENFILPVLATGV